LETPSIFARICAAGCTIACRTAARRETPGRVATCRTAPRHAATGRAASVLIALSVLVAVAVSLACSSRVSLAAVDWTLSPDIPKKPSSVKLSPLDRGSAYDLWAEILVPNYGITIGFVKALYDRGYDYGDIALLMEISLAARKEPSEVVTLKRRGLGWGAIAKRLGVHPATLERAKGNDSLFRRYTLARCMGSYYKIPDNGVLVTLNEKGYGFDDIVLTVNVSAHTGAPLRNVVSARQSGMKWRFVAEKYKMSPAKLGTPPGKSVSAKDKDKTAGPSKAGKTSKDSKAQGKK